MKKVGPETSPTASAWPVQCIYMLKKVGPETSPRECTWSVPRITLMKKVGPEVYSSDCTAYIREKMWSRLTLPPVHDLYSLYK
jgi:hypothetical protein